MGFKTFSDNITMNCILNLKHIIFKYLCWQLVAQTSSPATNPFVHNSSFNKAFYTNLANSFSTRPFYTLTRGKKLKQSIYSSRPSFLCIKLAINARTSGFASKIVLNHIQFT